MLRVSVFGCICIGLLSGCGYKAVNGELQLMDPTEYATSVVVNHHLRGSIIYCDRIAAFNPRKDCMETRVQTVQHGIDLELDRKARQKSDEITAKYNSENVATAPTGPFDSPVNTVATQKSNALRVTALNNASYNLYLLLLLDPY